MTTVRQINANRRNSELATGPRTERGKQKSRQSAVKHGLTSQTVFADDVEALVDERVASFSVTFPPQTDLDQWYVEQAALESVRIEQAQIHEHALLRNQAHRAETCWDDDRVLEAAKLLVKLPKKPEIVVYELEQTTQGCELMINRWKSLRGALKAEKPWNDVHRAMALDLLGVAAEFRAPDDADATTVEAQAELASGEIERLSRRQTEWLDAFDTRQQGVAIQGHAFPDREVWLVRRYESASQRRFHAALRYLMARPKIKATKPVAAFSAVVIQEEPANPFEEPSESIEELMAKLRAEEMRAEVEPAPVPTPIPALPVDDVFEEALKSPAPAPVIVNGNRRHRKAAQRRARQRVG